VTITKSVTSRQTIVGGFLYTGFEGYFSGYISNARIVKGTALYTANFTPPTSPLTAISGTSLLTCQSATFIDNSSNNFTITVNGNSRPTTVVPFTPTATTGVTYSPSVYGGSMYFDGAGDNLTLPSNQTQFTMGTGDFTIEMWVYVLSLAAARTLYDTMNSGDSTGTGRFAMQISTGGVIQIFTTTGTILTSGGTMTIGSWNHVAYARRSGSGRLYLNGIQVNSTYTDNNNYAIGNTNRPVIGVNAFDNSTNPMFGYISNLRVIKGSAIYTSTFAPPVSPLPAIQNSVLLLNGTSAGVYDSSMMNDYETVGNSNLVTSIKKYGNSSLYFDGTGDYLATNSTLITNFGAGLFTIESWVYFNSVSGTQYIMSTYQDSGTGWALGLFNSKFNFWSTGDGPDIVGTTTPVINTWYHLAVSGQTGSIKLFVNGIQEGSTYTGATALNSTSTLRVGDGAGAAAGQALNGYLDDVRITRGAARYTANFTPPSSPFITK
jgi:hypothetical protein